MKQHNIGKHAPFLDLLGNCISAAFCREYILYLYFIATVCHYFYN